MRTSTLMSNPKFKHSLLVSILGGIGIVLGWLLIFGLILGAFVGTVALIGWLAALVGITKMGFAYFVAIIIGLAVLAIIVSAVYLCVHNVRRYGFKEAWRRSWNDR